MKPGNPLSVPPFHDLILPDAGSHTARDILSLSLRRVLGELRGVLRKAPQEPQEGAEAAATLSALDELFGRLPGAVASVLRAPTVGGPFRCLRSALGGDDRARAVQLARTVRAQLAFALWSEGSLRAPLTLTQLPAQVLAPRANLGLDLRGVSAMVFDGPRLTVRRAEGEVTMTPDAAPEAPWVLRPYHPVTDRIALATADNNPLSMFEAHPDKQGNAIDLGGRSADAWCETLRACLDLVARWLPDLRAEIDLFVHQFVPVGYDDHRHLSASYQEAIGTIYLTLHPSLMTMTEAVVHEFSHNKLNALFELDPVLENAFWPLYTSPVRPDPRPLHGIVLAVHAFQPIARLYERMIEAGDPLAKRGDFLQRYDKIRKINHDGATVLFAHGKTTPAGRDLFDEMRRWDDHFGAPAA
ncbi:MAG: HEXXH motif-containing putative peptide modification protein [Polyangiales bacterium]